MHTTGPGPGPGLRLGLAPGLSQPILTTLLLYVLALAVITNTNTNAGIAQARAQQVSTRPDPAREARVYFNNNPEPARVSVKPTDKFGYAYLPGTPIVRARVEIDDGENDEDVPVICFFWKRSPNVLLPERGRRGRRGRGGGGISSSRESAQDRSLAAGSGGGDDDEFISLPFSVDDPLITPFAQAHRVYCYDRSRYVLRGIGDSIGGAAGGGSSSGRTYYDTPVSSEDDIAATTNTGDAEDEDTDGDTDTSDDETVSGSGDGGSAAGASRDDRFDIFTLFIENARGKRQLVRVPLAKQDEYGELNMHISYPTLRQGVLNVAVVEEAGPMGLDGAGADVSASTSINMQTGEYRSSGRNRNKLVRGICYMTLDNGQLLLVSLGKPAVKVGWSTGVALKRISCFRASRPSERVERWRSGD